MLATKIDIASHEMIAIGSGNLDTTQDSLRVRYRYSFNKKGVEAVNYSEEKNIQA